MSDLETRAEIAKLARFLGTTAERLAFLERSDARDVRDLRERMSATVSGAEDDRLARLAGLSRMLTAHRAARIAERALGPVLTARAAGLVEPQRAVKVATRMSVPFLADMTAELDARQVKPIVVRMPAPTVLEITRELVGRGDHMTMARFVDVVTDEALHAVLDGIDDNEALLWTVFYAESPAQFSWLIGLLPPERLRALVHLAMTGPVETRLAGLSLMSRVDDSLKRRLGDLAAAESDEVLTEFLNTAIREDAVAELLAVITRMSPSALDRVVRLPAIEDPTVYQAFVRTAAARNLWPSLLAVVGRTNDTVRHRTMAAIRQLDQESLAGLAATATSQKLWPVLLSLVADEDATTQEQIVGAWRNLDSTARQTVARYSQELGLDDVFKSVRTLINPTGRKAPRPRPPQVEPGQTEPEPGPGRAEPGGTRKGPEESAEPSETEPGQADPGA